MVCSPVKSAALLWALDERPQVREAIRHAHENAMNEALALIEEHAAYTRTGTGGIAQIAGPGCVRYGPKAGCPNERVKQRLQIIREEAGRVAGLDTGIAKKSRWRPPSPAAPG